MSSDAQPHASKGPLLLATGAVVLIAGLAYFVLSERSEDASIPELASSSQMPAGRGDYEARGGENKAGSALGRGWEAKGSRPSLHEAAPSRRPAAADASRERVERLVRVESADGSLTEERASEIRRTLQGLEERGDEGSTASDDLRRELENGQLDAAGSGKEHADAPEEVRPLLERLAGMTDPLEIAMLAQELEELAPETYREDVLNAARQALLRAAQDPPEERVDVSPIFELFEAYGNEGTARDLAQDTAWWPYSLMALAGMPDGQGIPSLIATASDSSIPVEQRPQLAFQLLAQATAEYPDAGQALVELARSGQIPERAWGALASALEGMHLSFPLQIFNDPGSGGENAPRLGGFESEGSDVLYDLRLVAPTWSEEQLQRQIDLIDQLIEATGSATGRDALNDARNSLLEAPPL